MLSSLLRRLLDAGWKITICKGDLHEGQFIVAITPQEGKSFGARGPTLEKAMASLEGVFLNKVLQFLETAENQEDEHADVSSEST